MASLAGKGKNGVYQVFGGGEEVGPFNLLAP